MTGTNDVEEMVDKEWVNLNLPSGGTYAGTGDLDDTITDEIIAELEAERGRSPHVARKGGRKRRALGKRLRFKILTRDGFRCCYCGANGKTVVLHVDHVLAVFRGGTNDERNLVTSCRDCNLGKATMLVDPLKPQRPISRHSRVEIDPAIEPLERTAALYWTGDQWKVTSDGIDTVDDRYFIAAHRIWEEEETYGWMRHMAEKEWVDIVEFQKALLFARRLFGFKPITESKSGKRNHIKS